MPGRRMLHLVLVVLAGWLVATPLQAQIGAPPLLVYWLGGQNSATTVRANIMVYFIMQGALSIIAYIYSALVVVARPLLWVTSRSAYGFLRLFGVVRSRRDTQSLSADELRLVVAEAGPLVAHLYGDQAAA